VKVTIRIAPKMRVVFPYTTPMYTNIGPMVIGSVWFFCAISMLFSQSCASTSARHQWIGAGIDAQTQHSKGDYDAAGERYGALLIDAPDEVHRRWIAFKLAELAKDQGDKDLAKSRAKAIHSENIEDEYGAKALFLWAQIDDKDALFWEVISTYPESYAAEKSIKHLMKTSQSPDAKRAFITGLHSARKKNPDSSLVDNLYLYEARGEYELGEANEAMALYRDLFHWDEEGSLADDALWEMAAIYRDAQQWEDAIAVYALFVDRIESSWFVGAYTPHLVDDSIFESGRISLLFLSDYKQAIQYFERYLEHFPEGILADDAMYLVSEAYRLLENPKAQRETVDLFKTTFPDSRYLRRFDND